MVSKCFFLLLLFSVVWCDVAKSAHYCWEKRILSKEQKCATKDVIWGWLNVVNQPALRAEAVKRNVSENLRHARSTRAKAQKLISEYEKFRESLYSISNNAELLSLVGRAIVDVNDTIAQTKKSELIANEAMEKAGESLVSSAICFDAIMRVACYLWKIDPSGEWNYVNVKEKLNKHGGDCKEAYNISKKLNDIAENMESMNLTAWKKKTLEALQKTYDDVKLNTSRYHWSVWNEGKVEGVKKAIEDAMDRLEIAARKFDLSHAAVDKAKKKLSDASRRVEETNNSLLASANGKMFCEVVGQLSRSNEKLRAAGKKLTDATQSALDAVTISKRVQAEVVIADELIKEVGVWLRGHNLALVHKLSGTHDVAKASNAMSTSVHAASKAVSIVNEIEQKMKTERELIKFVETQLANMSAVTGASISDVEFDVCSSRVSEILKKESSEVIRSIAKFNTALLTRLNATLHQIDEEADAIKQKLSDISEKVHEANSRVHSASLLEKQATENVREAIVGVLSAVVPKLCATVGELRALRDRSVAFNVHAVRAEANISEWVARTDGAAKESDGFADSSGSVEGAFATAGKRLEVLKRVLHRADEQRDKVVGELAGYMAVLENSNGASELNKTLRDVLANVASREAKTFSKDACNASLMTQSLKLLSNMTDHTAVMNSLQVVAQLNRLTESMKERVLKAHNLMRMAAESSAQADAALEEAIRMARERSGKPQCPALYRQLLGALGLHW